jgi:hypothetical protein
MSDPWARRKKTRRIKRWLKSTRPTSFLVDQDGLCVAAKKYFSRLCKICLQRGFHRQFNDTERCSVRPIDEMRLVTLAGGARKQDGL